MSVCPSIPETSPNCFLVLQYTSASMTLSPDGHTLIAVGNGTATSVDYPSGTEPGCRWSSTFTISFTGT